MNRLRKQKQQFERRYKSSDIDTLMKAVVKQLKGIESMTKNVEETLETLGEY